MHILMETSEDEIQEPNATNLRRGVEVESLREANGNKEE